MPKFVNIEDLLPGDVLEQDVFSDYSLLPISTKGTVLDEVAIEAFADGGIRRVCIVDAAALSDLDTPRPSIDPVVKEEALTSLRDLYSLVSDDEISHEHVVKTVKEVDTVVEHLVDSMLEDDYALVNIADLKSYDEYTYHHSLSVAVLSIAIGDVMGYSKEHLNTIGRSAMMHDIGKTAIPLDIINKPGRLTDNEFRIIQQHSQKGYDFLCRNNIGNTVLKEAVLYHHEKVNGTGYPHKLQGSRIPIISRIISVADVYDAITSNRPYRQPMEPQDAMEFIMGNIEVAFDYDVVMSFMRTLELYPVNSLVELSDGKIGRVINNDYSLRPMIQLIGEDTVLDLRRDYKLLNVTVKHAIPVNTM